MKAIYWVRNDLRINDNSALMEFYNHHNDGMAVWCPTASIKRASEKRLNFINENLKSFSLNLKSINVKFSIGDELFFEYLQRLHLTHHFKDIYFTQMHSTDEVDEEKKVKDFCDLHQITVHHFDQNTLIKEMQLPFAITQMPLVFTDFRKRCEAQLIISKPVLNFKHIQLDLTYKGEAQALERLKDYIWTSESIKTYKETRNGMINLNDSTKLSPWLSTGALSARIIYEEVLLFEKTKGANESTYWLFFELLWRDYFKFLSKKFGRQFYKFQGISGKKNGINLVTFDKKTFQAWCHGKTLEPFINANMKELNATGFMSNRGRQNVASYLVHDLKLPWTWGARYFEEHLIDYDAESNWGNWLYLSGNGTDPRSRKFNIKKQAQDYDPLELYQKKWNASE